jgi:hypothetical protein
MLQSCSVVDVMLQGNYIMLHCISGISKSLVAGVIPEVRVLTFLD